MPLEGGNRKELMWSVFNRALWGDFHGAGSPQPLVFSGCEQVPTFLDSWSSKTIVWMTCFPQLRPRPLPILTVPQIIRSLLGEDCRTAVFLLN
jgi:hypothetical protein